MSCNTEPLTIYSSVDGINHENILNGPGSIKKHTLELIYHLDSSISDENFELLIHELDSGSIIWKKYYLNGLTFYCDRLNTDQQLKLESALFKYLIFYPKEYSECIKKMEIQKSDCFLLSISNYVRLYLSRNEITIISMKNVAKNHCKNCTDSDIDFIYNYLDLANNILNE